MKNNQKIDKIISIKFFSLMIFNANLSRSISIRNLDKKKRHTDLYETRGSIHESYNSYFQFSRSLALNVIYNAFSSFSRFIALCPSYSRSRLRGISMIAA